MSNEQRTAQDVIGRMHRAPPSGRASDMLDQDKMKREGERLARQQRESIERIPPPRLATRPPR